MLRSAACPTLRTRPLYAGKALSNGGISARLFVDSLARVRTQKSTVCLVGGIGERGRQLFRDCPVLDPGAQRIEQSGGHATGSAEAVADSGCGKIAVEIFYFGDDFGYSVVVVLGAFGGDDSIGL